jgi:hypothetical protein
MHSFSPGRLVAPVLDALAEGALLWVVYVAAVGSPTGAAPRLGLPEFVATAGVGLAAARALPSPPGRRAVMLSLAMLAGAAGWLADPGVPAALRDAGVSQALGLHAPGWLLALAVWRGGAHLDPASDDRVGARVLAAGTPFLALPWLTRAGLGSDAMAGQVVVASVIFVAASLLAVAHGRLAALGLDPVGSGGTWRRTVLAVTAGLGLVAIGGVALVDASLTTVLGMLGGPLSAGLTALLSMLAPVGDPLARAISSALVHAALPALQAQDTAAPPAAGASPGSRVSPVVGPALLVAAALGVALLIRYRRVFSSPRPLLATARAEERRFVRPHLSFRLAAPRRLPSLPHRRSAPTDAVAAYLAAIEALAGHPDLARQPSESPRGHAARVQRSGLPGVSLSLLAADFQLQRYGDRDLSPREHRKALMRWRRVRAAVRARRRAPGA